MGWVCVWFIQNCMMPLALARHPLPHREHQHARGWATILLSNTVHAYSNGACWDAVVGWLTISSVSFIVAHSLQRCSTVSGSGSIAGG